MRQVITVLLDNVNTAVPVKTMVFSNANLSEIDFKREAQEIIEEHEGFEFMNNDRVSYLVDLLVRKWDSDVTSWMSENLYDLMRGHIDEDEFDLLAFDETAVFDSIPSLDVGALEEELKESRIVLTIEWRVRATWNNYSMYSASTESNDYFIIIYELPEV